MLQKTSHDEAGGSTKVAKATQKTHHAMARYDDYILWGAPKSNSTAEKDLSRAYDARLFAIRKRNEARRRQRRDRNQPPIKVA